MKYAFKHSTRRAVALGFLFLAAIVGCKRTGSAAGTSARAKYVFSVEFEMGKGSTDSKDVVSTLRVWDVATNQITNHLSVPGPIFDWAVSPDSSLAASADEPTPAQAKAGEYEVHLWNLKTGAMVHVLKGHGGKIGALAFSGDGSVLATASRGESDKTIKLWNPSTGAEIGTLSGHKHPVNRIAFSLDGKQLASASADPASDSAVEIKIWNVSTLAEAGTIQADIGSVSSLAFSPDGATLATGGLRLVTIWDVSTRKRREQFAGRFARQDASVTSIAFSHDGNSLATGHVDGAILIWPLAGGTDPKVLQTQHSSVTDQSFIDDDKTIAVGYFDGAMSRWDIAGEKEEKHQP